MIDRRTVLKTAAFGAAQGLALPYLAREGFAQAPAHTLKLKNLGPRAENECAFAIYTMVLRARFGCHAPISVAQPEKFNS